MKVLLLVVLLCFSLNFVSAFSWFSFGDKPATRPLIASRTTTLSQQQGQVKNVADAHRHPAAAARTNRVNPALTQRAQPAPAVQNQRDAAGFRRPAATADRTGQARLVAHHRFSPRQGYGGQWQRHQLKNATASGAARTPLQRAVMQYQQQPAVGQRSQALYQADSENHLKHQPAPQNVRPFGQHSQAAPASNVKYQPAPQNARPIGQRTMNNTNNRVFRPRVRPAAKQQQNDRTAALADARPNNPLLARKQMQSQQQQRTPLAKGNVGSAKTGALYRALTTPVVGHNRVQYEQRVPANPYFQQRWRAMHFGHSHAQPAVYRRKRDGESNNVPGRFVHGIILSRDEQE